jgi:hypothetical protein
VTRSSLGPTSRLHQAHNTKDPRPDDELGARMVRGLQAARGNWWIDMDESLKVIVTYLVTFIGGYLSRYLEPRARLVHWFPGWVTFPVTPPAQPGTATPAVVNISTHTLTIQNIGWRPATRVEIVHGQAPQLFRLTPQMHYTVDLTPSGEHVIRIDALARREWVAIQVLTVASSFPPLRSVRSTEGPSTLVTTRQTFVISERRRLLLNSLLVLGTATAIYWLWRIVRRAIPPFWNFIWQ